jgi:poly(3-hydroxybutyrate) depolymerase
MPAAVVATAALVLASAAAAAGDWIDVDAGRGPVPVRYPAGVASPAPLVVLLHGYGATGPGEPGLPSARRVAYDGGFLDARYPSAEQTIATWATYAGCADILTVEAPFDAESNLPGAETAVERYATGCGAGGAELWTIAGGSHIPALTDDFRTRLVGWLTTASVSLFGDGFEDGSTGAWVASGAP